MPSQLTINSNVASLQTQRQLAQNTGKLAQVFQRLSSGQRINRASDDAAGLAISSSLEVDSRVYTQGIRNLNDGLSALDIADGALQELTNIVIRIRELAEQAANGTLGASQRKSLDLEAQALSSEFTRIAQSTEFNRQQLLNGSVQQLSLQAGYGSSGSLAASIGGAMGDGTLKAGVSYAAESYSSWAITSGDINGDGLTDIITAGYQSSNDGRTTIRLGKIDGTFGASVSFLSETNGTYAVALGDVNLDGVLDLVTAGSSDAGPGTATIRIGNGNGTFSNGISYSTESSYSRGLALADLNNDGNIDLVSVGQAVGADGYSTIRLGRGDGTLGASISYAMESQISTGVSLGDLNGDAIVDLVTSGRSDGGNGYTTVRLGLGNGTFGAALSYTVGSANSNSVTLADLNNDKILDKISGEGATVIRYGRGDGTFSAAISYLQDFSFGIAAADMNGDGLIDVISAGSGLVSGGAVGILLNQGNGTFGMAGAFLSESDYSNGLTIGDFNADGVADVISAGVNTSPNGFATVLLGNVRNGIGAILPFSLKYSSTARQAMSHLDNKLKQIVSQRGAIGAGQSRIESAVQVISTARNRFIEAASQIRDADVAFESAQLIRLNILQQASAQILAQANREPELALSLLT